MILNFYQTSVDHNPDIPSVLITNGVNKAIGNIAFPGHQGTDHLGTVNRLQVSVLGQFFCPKGTKN